MERTSQSNAFPMLGMFFDTYRGMLEMQLNTWKMLPRVSQQAAQQTAEILPIKAFTDETIELGDENEVVPVIHEELRVSKRQVSRGKSTFVRVQVRNVPIEQEVILRTETARVEFKASSELVGDDRDLRERTIEVRDTTEEPVIEKIIRQEGVYIIHRTVSEKKTMVREMVRQMDVAVDEGKMPKSTALVLEPTFGPQHDHKRKQERHNEGRS